MNNSNNNESSKKPLPDSDGYYFGDLIEIPFSGSDTIVSAQFDPTYSDYLIAGT